MAWRLAVSGLLLSGLWLSTHSATADLLSFNQQERAVLESHGPWPPPLPPSADNRVSGQPAAIELGRRLFFDPDLSGDGIMSCAACHDPATAFGDGLATGSGRRKLGRNTPGLFNLVFARWFGWDGGADSLWAQSIRPILAPDEMAATPSLVTEHLAQSPELKCLYERAFGQAPDAALPEIGLVNAAKALAAFQETLVTARTPFDRFRDALLADDRVSAAAYPEAAQRGLKLFVGEGRCSLCHFGPQFSNGEFGDIGIPFFMGKGVVDKGRYGGIQKLKTSPYTLAGDHSDDPRRRGAVRVRHVRLLDRNWGEFKIPSLRNVAETAPYMHNGSLKTLREVIDHYSEIDEERLHVDGERILRPLGLNEREKADLVAFLESLSAPLSQPLAARPAFPACRADASSGDNG